MTDLQALQFIERDGDLHLAPCKSHEIPPYYRSLLSLRWIKQNKVANGPAFWEVTPAGRDQLAAAVPA